MSELNKIDKFHNWKIKWSNKSSLGLFDYVSFLVHPDDILIIYHLFFPSVTQVNGYIFLEENYSEETFNTLIEEKHEKVEWTINRVRIYDLFANLQEDVSDSIFLKIGEVLRNSWTAHFKLKFPHESIIVELINSDQEYGPVITFYQSKSG